MKRIARKIILLVMLLVVASPQSAVSNTFTAGVYRLLVIKPNIGIGLVSKPLKNISISSEHIEIAMLSDEICSYADKSDIFVSNRGAVVSLVGQIGHFFTSVVNSFLRCISGIL